MKKVNLIVLLLLPQVFASNEEQHWEKYKIEYQKSYESHEEEQFRFNIFKDNWHEINKHNERYKQGLTTYKMGINRFADITATEFCNRYKMYPGKTFVYNETLPEGNEIKHKDNDTVDYLDWRENGAVTPVKNQGTCGACWIFSTIGLLEGFYFKKHNKLISFSEQHILDCISNSSCLGGWPPEVLGYVEKHSVISGEEYKYEEKQGQCRQDKFQKIKFPHYKLVDIKNDETELKKAVTNFGPVVVCVYASSKWQFYKSGVYYEKECSNIANHAVLLVGYGSENGADYWLIKNSLGKDWGENGYIKIIRNKHHNYCGITANSFYIV